MGRLGLCLSLSFFFASVLLGEWLPLPWNGGPIRLVRLGPGGEVYLFDRNYVWCLRDSGAFRLCRLRGGQDLEVYDALVWRDKLYWASSLGLFAVELGQERKRAKRLFSPPGKLVSCIEDTKAGLLIGTEEGIYQSTDGLHWSKVLTARGVLDLRLSPSGHRIAILTEDRLIVVDPKGWEGLYEKSWVPDSETAPYRGSQVVWDGDKVLFVRGKSVWEIDEKESDKKVFDYPGELRGVLFPEEAMAYGDRGIFLVYSGESDDQGLEDLDIYSGDFQGSYALVCSSRRLYVRRLQTVSPACLDGDRMVFLWKMFAREPAIDEIHRVAMQVAEVSPEKIIAWREAVRKRALLPKVSLDVDLSSSRSVSDSVAVSSYGNSNVGPDDKTVYSSGAFGISLEWDLKDLVWSKEEISIDTRSKLTVELRDDILDQVNQTYFERRKLQTRLVLSPPKDVAKLLDLLYRIQRLRSDLDAITDGYVSKVLKRNGIYDWELDWVKRLIKER